MNRTLQQRWEIPRLESMTLKHSLFPWRWKSTPRNRIFHLPPLTKGDRGGFAIHTVKKSPLFPFCNKGEISKCFVSNLATNFANRALMGLMAAAILISSCAAARPYRPRPIERYPSAQDPIATPPPVNEPRASQPTPQDAIDCERHAATAGAGSKAAVFNECMRNRKR